MHKRKLSIENKEKEGDFQEKLKKSNSNHILIRSSQSDNDTGSNETNEETTNEYLNESESLENDDYGGSESISINEDKNTQFSNTQIMILKKIQSLVKKAEASGHESVGGPAYELPVLPGLYIKDFGNVQLPIDEKSGESLIEIGKQAPYGIKFQTLVDTNIRDSFQIEPNSIDIKNPEWQAKLRDLVERVAKNLGFNGKIEAKLYKLLIYRKGGHFKKHKDTEKDKNMFATLVIQLPSIHEGGELVIHNKDGTIQIYDFGQSEGKAAYMPHFVAHYADIEHELLEVKSGYRLALVYSLCWINGNSTKLEKNCETVSDLTKCFDLLNSADYQIAIALDHEYTASSLQQNGIKALKGIDNDRYNLLFNVNSRLEEDKKLSFYIARAELWIYSCDYNGGHCENSRDFSIENDEESNDGADRDKDIIEWYNIYGDKCFNFKSHKLNIFDHIIDPNSKTLFCDMNETKSYGKTAHVHVEGGYFGNEEPSKTTAYNRYLLFCWPKQTEFSKFLKINKVYAADVLYASFRTDFYHFNFQKNLKVLISKFIESDTDTKKALAPKILDIFSKESNIDLVKQFLENVDTSVDITKIANLIEIYTWDALKSQLKKFLFPMKLKQIQKNCDLVQDLIVKNENEYALNVFEFAVVPILYKKFRPEDDQKQENYNKSNEGNKSKILALIQLAETIIYFDLKKENEFSLKYTELVINKIGEEADEWLNLFEKFEGNTKLISFLNFDLLYEKLSKHTFIDTKEKLLRSCQILKIFLNSNETELANKWFEKFIEPVLDDVESNFREHNPRKYKEEEELKNCLTIYYKLADTIALFKFDKFDELCDKYTSLICREKFLSLYSIIANLLKQFLTKPSLIKLINFDVILTTLSKELDTDLTENLIQICDIIKVLFKFKLNKTARKYLTLIVLPILKRNEPFITNVEENEDLVIKLVEMIVLFKDEAINEIFANLITKISAKDPKVLKDLIDLFNSKQESFCASAAFLKLYKLRYNYLKGKLAKKETKFTWFMPGTIQNHPKLDSYFHSEELWFFTYTGAFNGIHEARNFVAQYSGLKSGYSVTMETTGSGANSRVKITKTKAFHEQKIQKFNSFESELKQIKTILDKFTVKI